MCICCTVCWEWYTTTLQDTLDICLHCTRANFSGNLLETPSAREALDAYVSMTPRQLDALRSLHARWEEEACRRVVEAEGQA
jgi:hypothetical protein